MKGGAGLGCHGARFWQGRRGRGEEALSKRVSSRIHRVRSEILLEHHDVADVVMGYEVISDHVSVSS